MYFSIGYPLGYFKTCESPLEYRNKIELKGQFAMLDLFLSTVWTGLSACKSDDDAIQEIDEFLATVGYTPNNDTSILNILDMLIEKGVVIHANSNAELFEQIKDFKVIRSGLPHYDDEAMTNSKELKTIMFVGSEPTPISDLQLDIWRKSNGTKTLEVIFNENFPNITLSDFVDNICYLRDEGLLLFYLS